MRIKNKWNAETWRVAAIINGIFLFVIAGLCFLIDSWMPMWGYVFGTVVGQLIVHHE